MCGLFAKTAQTDQSTSMSWRGHRCAQMIFLIAVAKCATKLHLLLESSESFMCLDIISIIWDNSKLYFKISSVIKVCATCNLDHLKLHTTDSTKLGHTIVPISSLAFFSCDKWCLPGFQNYTLTFKSFCLFSFEDRSGFWCWMRQKVKCQNRLQTQRRWTDIATLCLYNGPVRLYALDLHLGWKVFCTTSCLHRQKFHSVCRVQHSCRRKEH